MNVLWKRASSSNLDEEAFYNNTFVYNILLGKASSSKLDEDSLFNNIYILLERSTSCGADEDAIFNKMYICILLERGDLVPHKTRIPSRGVLCGTRWPAEGVVKNDWGSGFCAERDRFSK